jgi:hypothetical protein
LESAPFNNSSITTYTAGSGSMSKLPPTFPNSQRLLDGAGGSGLGSGSGSGRKSVESINSKNKGKLSSIQLASNNILNPSSSAVTGGGSGEVNSGRKNSTSLKIPVVSIGGGAGGGGNAINRSQSSSIGDLGSHLSKSMDSLTGHPIVPSYMNNPNNNISNLSTSRSSNASSTKLYQLDGKTAEEKIAELMNLNLQEIKSTEVSEVESGFGGGKKEFQLSTSSLALSNQSSIASSHSHSQNKRNNMSHNKKR